MPIGVFEHVCCVCVPLFLSSWLTGNDVALGVVGKEFQRDHNVCLEVEVERKTEVSILW